MLDLFNSLLLLHLELFFFVFKELFEHLAKHLLVWVVLIVLLFKLLLLSFELHLSDAG